jgi:hypothetical protein
MTGAKLPYSVTETTTALGVAHEFHGPGMARISPPLYFMQPLNEAATLSVNDGDNVARIDADRVTSLLNAAYEAGRESMADDVRKLIGAKGWESQR